MLRIKSRTPFFRIQLNIFWFFPTEVCLRTINWSTNRIFWSGWTSGTRPSWIFRRQCHKLSWFQDHATVPWEIRKTRSSLADVLGAIPSLIPLLAASPKTHSLRSLTFLHRGVINSADNTSYEPKEKKGLLFLSFLRFLALSLLRGSSILFLCYLSLGFFSFWCSVFFSSFGGGTWHARLLSCEGRREMKRLEKP